MPPSLKTAVRPATLNDAVQILKIFNDEIKESSANYESVPQTLDQRTLWLKHLLELKYPVLVSVSNEQITGFASLSPFHSQSGYRFTATGSVYIDKNYRKQGVGKFLLAELKRAAIKKEIHTVIAGVNAKNRSSIALLKSFGFKEVGFFKEIGFKNGAWMDDVCLQLIL